LIQTAITQTAAEAIGTHLKRRSLVQSIESNRKRPPCTKRPPFSGGLSSACILRIIACPFPPGAVMLPYIPDRANWTTKFSPLKTTKKIQVVRADLMNQGSYQKATFSIPFKPKIFLASSGVAGSMPNSRAMRTILATCSALLFAIWPFSR